MRNDASVAEPQAVNEPELERFAQRAGERWALSRALVGGARVDDARHVVPQRERGPEFVVILVADGFAEVPWLERVHAAAELWDVDAMGAPAEIHCYTSSEFERRRSSQPVVRWASERGMDLPL